MIIKSMSRKTASFGQLIDYIDRENGQNEHTIRHNFFGVGRNDIHSEFEENARLLRKRRGANFMYHEILSMTRAEGISEAEQKQKLRDIAEDYIAARCPGNLAYGGLHQDKDHSFHFHLIISANEVGEQNRTRLSKAQFRDLTVRFEQDVLKRYPELEQKVAIDKKSERIARRKETEMQRRGGVRTRRLRVTQEMYAALEGTQTREELFRNLEAMGLRLDTTKKHLRVFEPGQEKAHRLQTLDTELERSVRSVLAMGREELDQKRTDSNVYGQKQHSHQEPQGREQTHKTEPREPLRGQGSASKKEKRAGDPREAETENTKASQPDPVRDELDTQAKWREQIRERRAAEDRDNNQDFER